MSKLLLFCSMIVHYFYYTYFAVLYAMLNILLYVTARKSWVLCPGCNFILICSMNCLYTENVMYSDTIKLNIFLKNHFTLSVGKLKQNKTKVVCLCV